MGTIYLGAAGWRGGGNVKLMFRRGWGAWNNACEQRIPSSTLPSTENGLCARFSHEIFVGGMQTVDLVEGYAARDSVVGSCPR